MTTAEKSHFKCAYSTKRHHTGMRMLGTSCRGDTVWMASVHVLDEQDVTDEDAKVHGYMTERGDI